MRISILMSLTVVAGCGGPVGLPVGAPNDDTGTTVAPTHGSIEGAVLDTDGLPITGAHVVTVPRGHEASTDADGAFVLDWLPPAEYRLVAAASGYQALEQGTFVVEAGQSTAADLTLEPLVAGGLVQVAALGPDGAPLEGAVVSSSTGVATTTDAHGLAVLEGVHGESIQLRIEAADGSLWPRTLEDVDIDTAGGLQWQARLAGRPPAEASYAGPVFCGYCHPDHAEALAATPHARAHVLEPSDALAAAFAAGTSLELGHARLELWLDGEAPSVTLIDRGGAALSFEVISYLGDPGRSTVPVVAWGERSFPLPVVWLAGSDLRAGYPDSEPRLAAYERERWLDDEGAFALGDDGPDPAASAEAACLPCHSSSYTLTLTGDGGAELSYPTGDGRYAGVGCEACHGPGSAHISTNDPHFVTSPDELDASRADEACGQCHARTRGLDSGLPHPYAEPERFVPGSTLADLAAADGEAWPSGAAAVGRMQLDEHRISTHGLQGLRCLDCHQVHDTEAPSEPASPSLLRLPSRDNALCDACHLGPSYADEEAALAHTGHLLYQPEGAQEGARCTGCHMPPTASDGPWSAESGAGQLSSHLFVAASPADTLALFDAAGAEQLELGEFPPHACSDCHAWNAWYLDDLGGSFAGPSGDPRLASTHEDFLASWEAIYP